MTAVVTRNPDETQDVIDPVKDDGTRYRYEMIFDGSRSRAYADTTADLLDVFVTGYAQMAPTEQVTARIRYASSLLAPIQAAILNDVDQTAIDPDDLALLLQPRYEAVTVDEWASEVPLVLLDVHYAPHSDLPAPVSALEDVTYPRNLVWLRAADEFEFLLSLDRAGLISLGQNNDFLI